MALRDQPYIPLYVQDFLTDEKLMECSAATTGVYIRLMCILHKSEHYGKILLKQKDKQSKQQIINFACKVAKHFPYTLAQVEAAILELVEEKVLKIEGDFLIQPRMVKDYELSVLRAKSGSKGGKKTAKKFATAKLKANSEYEYENENDIEIKDETVKKKPKKQKPLIFKHPDFPFPSDRFIKAWDRWKAYKRDEFSFKYKSQETELTALHELARLAKGNETTALKIIERSMANGWKGFWEIKESANGKKRVDVTEQDIIDELRRQP